MDRSLNNYYEHINLIHDSNRHLLLKLNGNKHMNRSSVKCVCMPLISKINNNNNNNNTRDN